MREQNQHRNHFTAYEEKQRQQHLSLSVVTSEGTIKMNLSKKITRRDIPELERVIQEISLRCRPHHTDTERETDRRWIILDAFFREIQERSIEYRGSTWRLSYVIDRLLPGTPLLELRGYLDALEAKVSNAANAAIEFDADEINRLREMKEGKTAEAARAAMKKLLGDK